MKIIVKQLQGGECTLEVFPNTCIIEIKRKVAKELHIPVEQQKLLLLGRTLVDEQPVQSYLSIKDGTKLNLVVKKPDGLYEESIKYFKKIGMSDIEATKAAKRFLEVIQEKFNKLSWDDIDRLAYDCLLEESGEPRPTNIENDPENEECFGL